MIQDLIVATRVHINDFNIFKIWFDYHKSLSKDFCCCIHSRPGDKISPILEFCEKNSINYTIVKSDEFDNRLTLDELRKVIESIPAKVVLHIDCDEFVTDFGELSFLCERIIYNDEQSFTCWMVDRVNEDLSLYDISSCNSYEDLCAIAPIKTNRNKRFYLSDYKCFLNSWPMVGFIHEPDPGVKSIHVPTSIVSLDHFKWRLEWYYKVNRRVKEVKSQKLNWAHRLEHCLASYEQTGKI